MSTKALMASVIYAAAQHNMAPQVALDYTWAGADNYGITKEYTNGWCAVGKAARLSLVGAFMPVNGFGAFLLLELRYRDSFTIVNADLGHLTETTIEVPSWAGDGEWVLVKG